MRFLLLAILAYVLYRLVRFFFISSSKKLHKTDPTGTIDEMVQDPVCKTYIPVRGSQRRIIGGKEYFFAVRSVPADSRRSAKGRGEHTGKDSRSVAEHGRDGCMWVPQGHRMEAEEQQTRASVRRREERSKTHPGDAE